MLKTENRFSSLTRNDPATATKLHEELDKHIHAKRAGDGEIFIAGSKGNEGGRAG
jgi:hypothetical protein